MFDNRRGNNIGFRLRIFIYSLMSMVLMTAVKLLLGASSDLKLDANRVDGL